MIELNLYCSLLEKTPHFLLDENNEKSYLLAMIRSFRATDILHLQGQKTYTLKSQSQQ